jgi:steroid 5-alpha reductase family enzyme
MLDGESRLKEQRMGLFRMTWIGWGIVSLAMLSLFLYQRSRHDAGIVDVGWAAGVGFLALFYAILGEGDPVRRTLVAAMGIAWGGRLAFYLFRDRVLPPGEDGRYKTLREKWGGRAQLWFFLFFQVQAAWAVLFSLPFLAAAVSPVPALTPWDVLGIAVFAAAVGGEALADRQLSRFRAEPANRGKVCREGLWRYSRHPNYFFEWVHWFAYMLLAAGSPLWLLTLLGPALMLLFLFKITGIPYTEAQALKSRGEAYREYQRTTSSFLPWFPREPRN